MFELPGSSGAPIWIVMGSFPAAGDDPLHRLIRDARAGDPAATSSVIDAVSLAAAGHALRVASNAVVVPVPGHHTGSVSPLVAACAREIARAGGWRLVEGCLRRRREVLEAKLGGERDPASEAESLDWSAPRPGRTIVLVDDVVRTGTTIDACVRAIRVAGDAREIVAVVVAAARPGERVM